MLKMHIPVLIMLLFLIFVFQSYLINSKGKTAEKNATLITFHNNLPGSHRFGTWQFGPKKYQSWLDKHPQK